MWNGMAHEISVLAISHEVISQFDLCRRHFDFKVLGGIRNHTPVRLVEFVCLLLIAENVTDLSNQSMH